MLRQFCESSSIGLGMEQEVLHCILTSVMVVLWTPLRWYFTLKKAMWGFMLCNYNITKSTYFEECDQIRCILANIFHKGRNNNVPVLLQYTVLRSIWEVYSTGLVQRNHFSILWTQWAYLGMPIYVVYVRTASYWFRAVFFKLSSSAQFYCCKRSGPLTM